MPRRHSRFALRIALLWQGRVLSERLLSTPSESRRVTVGEDADCDIVLSGHGLPRRDTLMERAHYGYALNLLPGMRGKLVQAGEEHRLEIVGRQTRYVTPGDWGLLGLGSASIFFQFVEPSKRPPRSPWWRALDGWLMTAIWFSLLAQGLFLFVARLTAS